MGKVLIITFQKQLSGLGVDKEKTAQTKWYIFTQHFFQQLCSCFFSNYTCTNTNDNYIKH